MRTKTYYFPLIFGASFTDFVVVIMLITDNGSYCSIAYATRSTISSGRADQFAAVVIVTSYLQSATVQGLAVHSSE